MKPQHFRTHFIAPLLLTFGLALSSLAPAAHSQDSAPPAGPDGNSRFEQLTSGKSSPPTIKLKGLTKEWRRITVNTQDTGMERYYGGFQGPLLQELLADMGVGVYYTRGQSVTLGNETYLIAYRIKRNITQQEMQDMMQNLYGGHGAQPARTGPKKFPPDTTLMLSLLNLRTTGSLNDLRPFDPQREIMGPRDVIEASNENLKQIGRYLPKMSQFERYGVRGLPMRDVKTARNAFRNYFHAPLSIFVHPQTGQPYRPNTALAGRRLSLIANRARLVAFSEPRSGTDGKRGVVFLNGRVERVPESKWTTVSRVKPQELEPKEIDALSLNNLKQLGAGLLRYPRRRGGVLPPMNDIAAVRRALNSIGQWNAPFLLHPKTREPYRPNPALSGKKLAKIANRARLAACYEARPGADGRRGVVFLDGHVERVPQSQWNRVKDIKVQMK